MRLVSPLHGNVPLWQVIMHINASRGLPSCQSISTYALKILVLQGHLFCVQFFVLWYYYKWMSLILCWVGAYFFLEDCLIFCSDCNFHLPVRIVTSASENSIKQWTTCWSPCKSNGAPKLLNIDGTAVKHMDVQLFAYDQYRVVCCTYTTVTIHVCSAERIIF